MSASAYACKVASNAPRDFLSASSKASTHAGKADCSYGMFEASDDEDAIAKAKGCPMAARWSWPKLLICKDGYKRRPESAFGPGNAYSPTTPALMNVANLIWQCRTE